MNSSQRLCALTGMVLVIGCAGCSLVQKPSAQITGASVQGVGLTESTLVFDVKIDNPYSTALPLTNLDYALSSQGQPFLSGKADVRGTVPAGGSKVIGVPVRINYLDVVKAVKGARPGAAIAYKAELGLSVDVPLLGNTRLPLSREGELTIPSSSTLLDQLRGLAQ